MSFWQGDGGKAGGYGKGYGKNKGYGKGSGSSKGYGKGYSKGSWQDQRSGPYANNRGSSFEHAVSRSFQSALGSTLECAITEGFSMVASRLAGEGRPDVPQHVSPPARAGSALTRAIVSLFGGSQQQTDAKAANEPAQKPVSESEADAASSTEATLKAALVQQTQTVELLTGLMKPTLEAGGNAKGAEPVHSVEAPLVGTPNHEADKIAKLESQVESLMHELHRAKASSSCAKPVPAKAKVQSILPFKLASPSN